MMRPARVFTLPSSVPFLPTLVDALIKGRVMPGFAAEDPAQLASATLYLPTRRAGRIAREAFLDALGGRAAILPRILPIGDIDEDEFAFADLAGANIAAEALELPPAISDFHRRLLLARLVLQWARSPQLRREDASLVVASPTAALALADDLARLMDDLLTRQVPWDRLDKLVPNQLDAYWSLTLEFLKIARVNWPKVLAERGLIEPAERRDRLIAAEAARLAAQRSGPVIAAGSTGSIPATATLLATIAKLPHGAVVLPGLDTALDEESWNGIAGSGAANHPQFAMRALLARIGISRSEVVSLAPPAEHGRETLVSEALRPAATAERWHLRRAEPTFADNTQAGMRDVAVIEAATADDEALAIAVALREALETPNKTAALVTPDRALARRVTQSLARWNVNAADTGGESLAETQAGVFARLAADAVLGGVAPVALLALLKHPRFRLSADTGAHLDATAALELALLRGPRPRPGIAGLAHALAAFRRQRDELHRSDPRRRLSDRDLDSADTLIAKLAAALDPLCSLDDSNRPLAEFAERHAAVLAALNADREGLSNLFDGEAGSALATLLEDLAGSEESGLSLSPTEYADIFAALLAERIVRRAPQGQARVHIFGLLEARLQRVDRVVLGGLVEGVWPPQPRSDPWLSRSMRQELGLDLPERRIGLAAHDFAQLLGAPEVILTRPLKRDGAPTVASRFLQRLAAVAGDALWSEARRRGQTFLALAQALDQPAAVKPVAPPEPCPPRVARPTAMSVTDIENWLRDPYTIYAKHILGLVPIEAVDTPPGAADRGTVIHGAIGEFTERYAKRLPDDPLRELIALGAKHFAPLEDYPEARAFWWPRFLRIAKWFVDWERERRKTVSATFAETRGHVEIALESGRTFIFSARADRIDVLRDGRLAILDYKTGQARTEPQVRAGFAPQLTLESAILREGGFREIPAGGSVAEVGYVRLGGGDPAGREIPIVFREGTPDTQADIALRRLREVALRFEDEAEPYRSLVSSMWATRYGDYDHLARVKEWSASGGGDNGEGGEG